MSATKLLKAIRKQCVNCMGNQAFLVPNCTAPNCSLFPYRMGKDAKIVRKGKSTGKAQ